MCISLVSLYFDASDAVHTFFAGKLCVYERLLQQPLHSETAKYEITAALETNTAC